MPMINPSPEIEMAIAEARHTLDQGIQLMARLRRLNPDLAIASCAESMQNMFDPTTIAMLAAVAIGRLAESQVDEPDDGMVHYSAANGHIMMTTQEKDARGSHWDAQHSPTCWCGGVIPLPDW